MYISAYQKALLYTPFWLLLKSSKTFSVPLKAKVKTEPFVKK